MGTDGDDEKTSDRARGRVNTTQVVSLGQSNRSNLSETVRLQSLICGLVVSRR